MTRMSFCLVLVNSQLPFTRNVNVSQSSKACESEQKWSVLHYLALTYTTIAIFSKIVRT